MTAVLGDRKQGRLKEEPAEEASAKKRSDVRVDKFEERRTELADAALHTLAELGYARTSLREIAANTQFSHGVLHYYFTDKVELITFCVKRYKAQCVTRYDQIVSSATTANELKRGFAEGLVQTLIEDANIHRLWYDLRGQSLFEEAFRVDVAEIDGSLESMIWRIVEGYSELSGTHCSLSPKASYACLDGLFEHALLRHFAQDPNAGTDLAAAVELLLPKLLA